MKIIGIELYSINELQGKAKEKAIEKIKENIIELNFEDFTNNAKWSLENDLGLDATLKHSLGYSQGDGLRFTTSFFNTKQVIAALDLDESTITTIQKLTDDKDLIVSINDNEPFSRYSYNHPRQVSIDFSENINDLIPNYMIEKITKAFVDTYLRVCNDLEKQGYACYDVSEEDCITCSNDNEYFYFDNGVMFHG
jgi:hypothetical protein